MSSASLADYAAQLNKEAGIGIVIMIVVAIVAIVSFFLLIKDGPLDKKEVFLLSLFVVIELMAYITTVHPYRADIKDQSYDVYSGKFYVEDFYITRNGTDIFIKHNENEEPQRYKVVARMNHIKEHSVYRGKLVTSRRSKVLLEAVINEKLENK